MHENKDSSKKASKSKHTEQQTTHSNYYILSSLIDKYLIALKENKLDSEKVNIEYPEGTYCYKFSTLFKKIHSIEIDKSLERKTKIFYGEASINPSKSSNQSGYWVVFKELFKNSKKKILCFIDNEIIQNTVNYQFKERIILKNSINKTLYVFIMGKAKETVKNIYININPRTLDMMEISNDDILLTKSSEVNDIEEQ